MIRRDGQLELVDVAGVDVAGVWQPARTVGGDYYDFLKLSDTQLGICIGDVAGKGMPAAPRRRPLPTNGL